jgi:protein involved in polysaccharide export with SLBB domain
MVFGGRCSIESVEMSLQRNASGCALALTILGVIVGCAHPPPPSETAVAVPFIGDRLGVDDVFEVRVYGEADLSGTYRVSSDGTIDFPLAGRMSVLGLGSGDVQQEIVRRLKQGYLQNPQVTLMVKEWNSRKISVLGQVQRPGAVAYFPKMTIVDAIASAGGFSGIASKNSVNLRRETGGKVVIQTLPVADIAQGRSPNVVLLPGDVVVVDERIF